MSFMDDYEGLFAQRGAPPQVPLLNAPMQGAVNVSNDIVVELPEDLAEPERMHLLQQLFGREPIAEFDPDDEQVNPYAAYYRTRMQVSSDRIRRIKDCIDMGEDSLIRGVLDLQADEMAQYDPIEKRHVWIKAENPQVQQEADGLLEDTEMEDNIFPLGISEAQFGDVFTKLLFSARDGRVTGFQLYAAEDVERKVDLHGRLTGFRVAGENKDRKPFEFVHYRILAAPRTAREGHVIYGTSNLEGARRVWRKLKLLLDALFIYRMEISTRHRVFYLDTGGMDFFRALRYTRKVRREWSRRSYYNSLTGEFNSRFSPFHFTSDVWWPRRTGSNSQVDYIGTDANLANIADVDLLFKELFVALKTPPEAIGYGEYTQTRTSLSQTDVNFARSMARGQNGLKRGIAQMFAIHLATRGVDLNDPRNRFQVCMSTISTIDQQQRLTAIQMATEAAAGLRALCQELNLPDEPVANWIATQILGLTPYDLAKVGVSPDAAGLSDQLYGDQGDRVGSLDEAQQAILERASTQFMGDGSDFRRHFRSIRRDNQTMGERDYQHAIDELGLSKRRKRLILNERAFKLGNLAHYGPSRGHGDIEDYLEYDA